MKSIKKPIILLIVFALFSTLLFSADNKQKIGESGDKAWADLIAKYKSSGKYADFVSAKVIVNDFKNYEGKLMTFPKINFQDFLTDRNGDKYYFYGDKNSIDFFVIKYNNEINSKLQKLVYVFGGLKGDYEVLGTIKEAYLWWGNVVLMDIKAIREPGRICVIIDNDKVNFVAEDLVQLELDQKEKEGDKDIPKGLKSVPKGLDPLMAAKLFFYVSSVEKNREVWLQLLSKKDLYYGSGWSSSVDNYWEYLTNRGRTYFYVRVDDVRTQGNDKGYYFQIKQNGENVGSPKPITVTLVDGEWRVKSANP